MQYRSLSRRSATDSLPTAESPRLSGPPIATYSIVAGDEGSLGVAVQSHWFSVGSIVPWVEAGVGAVAIQSIPNPAHGPLALGLLRDGHGPAAALEQLLSGDAEREFRQIAIVDGNAGVATHTGRSCIPAAGHQTGEGFTAQANLMDRDTVWGAMAEAFSRADGDLGEKLLRALYAAEAEGGDIRGRQSAAIVVVAAEPTGSPAAHRVLDLRVEDHSDPLAELDRLVTLRRAYLKLNDGDELLARGDLEAALEAYRAAAQTVPDEATGGEAAFWTGISLAGAGQEDEAIGYLRRAQEQRNWARLVPRLAARILPDDAELIERLAAGMRRVDPD